MAHALQIIGMVLASFIAVAGIASANGMTANIIAGCECLSHACMQACGPDASLQCCTNHQGSLVQVPPYSQSAGYVISLMGMAGFFVLLGMRKQEPDY